MAKKRKILELGLYPAEKVANIISAGLALLMLCSAATLWASAAEPASLTNKPPFELFKSFLQDRPVINTINYRVNWLTRDPGGATNKSRYFSAKWQPNGFFWGPMTNSLNLGYRTPAIGDSFDNFFCSKYENNYWSISRGQLAYWADETIAPIPTIGVVSQADIGEKMLADVLNMGIAELKHGTIRWSGNSFEAKTASDDRVLGDLVVGEDNLPKEINCVYKKGNQRDVDKFWKIRYTFNDKSGLTFLPDKIEVLYIPDKDRTQPYKHYEILSLAIGGEPGVRTDFDLAGMGRSNKLFIARYTPHIIALESPGGKYADLKLPASFVADPKEKKHRQLIALTMFASCSLGLLVVILKTLRKVNGNVTQAFS